MIPMEHVHAGDLDEGDLVIGTDGYEYRVLEILPDHDRPTEIVRLTFGRCSDGHVVSGPMHRGDLLKREVTS